jgi:hypothetical protein
LDVTDSDQPTKAFIGEHREADGERECNKQRDSDPHPPSVGAQRGKVQDYDQADQHGDQQPSRCISVQREAGRQRQGKKRPLPREGPLAEEDDEGGATGQEVPVEAGTAHEHVPGRDREQSRSEQCRHGPERACDQREEKAHREDSEETRWDPGRPLVQTEDRHAGQLEVDVQRVQPFRAARQQGQQFAILVAAGLQDRPGFVGGIGFVGDEAVRQVAEPWQAKDGGGGKDGG